MVEMMGNLTAELTREEIEDDEMVNEDELVSDLLLLERELAVATDDERVELLEQAEILNKRLMRLRHIETCRTYDR